MPKGIYKRTKEMKTGKHMLGRKLSKRWKKNIGKSLKGHKTSQETTEKIREANKKLWKNSEYKRKRLLTLKGQLKGEKHWAWKGGISKNRNYRNFMREERERRKKAAGSHTFGEWELLKKQYGYCCPACRKCEPEIKLTEDHIIPLSKGGSNYIENIQPLCRSCNSHKHTKIIKYELEKNN